MNNIVSIDTGNGFGKVAWVKDKNSDPVFLLDASMPGGMPTTAYVTPDGTVEVNNVSARLANRAVYNVKTHFDKDKIDLEEAGIKYSVPPSKVYAAVTVELLRLANEELKKRKQQPSYQIVLTYPASFINTDKPEKMKKCVEEATLDGNKIKVIAMLPEPSAAAIDAMYESLKKLHLPTDKTNRSDTDMRNHAKIVYDLGHGTFDAALVKYTGDPKSPFDAIDHEADPETGGRVFDRKIKDEILLQLSTPDEYKPTPRELDMLEHSVAVEMKHSLSYTDTAFYHNFVKTGDTQAAILSLTKDKFRKLIKNDENVTFAKLSILLEIAEKEGITVDEVILTGGSCNIPFIKTDIENELRKNSLNIPVNLYKPAYAVVFGAAHYALNCNPVTSTAKTAKDTTENTDPVSPETDKSNKEKHPEILRQHLETDYCLRSGNTIHKLVDRTALLPAKSEKFTVRGNGGKTEIIVYHTRNKKNFTSNYNSDVYAEVRRFHFYIKGEATIEIHVDNIRRATIVCKDSNGNIIDEC